MSYKEDLKLVESVIDTKADIAKLCEANKALVRLEALAKKSDEVLDGWDEEIMAITENQKKLDELEDKDPSPSFVTALPNFQEASLEEQKQILFIILLSEDRAREHDSIIEGEYIKAMKARNLDAVVDALNRHNGIKHEFAVLNFLQTALLKNPSFAASINCDLRAKWYEGVRKELDKFNAKEETKKA